MTDLIDVFESCFLEPGHAAPSSASATSRNDLLLIGAGCISTLTNSGILPILVGTCRLWCLRNLLIWEHKPGSFLHLHGKLSSFGRCFNSTIFFDVLGTPMW